MYDCPVDRWGWSGEGRRTHKPPGLCEDFQISPEGTGEPWKVLSRRGSRSALCFTEMAGRGARLRQKWGVWKEGEGMRRRQGEYR